MYTFVHIYVQLCTYVFISVQTYTSTGENIPVKTYTRTVETLFTLDQVKTLFKEAHDNCKAKIPPKFHQVGTKRKRWVKTRDKALYQACIKEYINEKVRAALGAT